MSNYDIAYIFKAIDKFSEPLKKINGAMANFDKQTKKSESSLKRFRTVASTAGKFLLTSVVAPLAGLGVYAYKNAEQFKTMQIRLESVMGSASNAAQIMETIKKTSMSTGIVPEELAQTATSLKAAGYRMDELNGKMKEMSVLAIGSGKSIEGITSIFNKAKMTGQMSTRGLVMLGHMGIPLLDAIQKKYGLSADAMKVMQKHALGMKLIEPVLKDMTREGSAFYESYKKMLMTSGTSADRIHNTLRFISADIGEGIMKAFGFDEGLKSIADKLQEMEPKIKAFLATHKDWIKFVGYAGLAAAGIGLVLMALTSIPILIGLSVAAVAILYNKFAFVKEVVDDFYLGLVGIKTIIMKIVHFAEKIGVGRFFNRMGNFIQEHANQSLGQVAAGTLASNNPNLATIAQGNMGHGLFGSSRNVDVNVNTPKSIALTQGNKTVGIIPMHAATGRSMGHV